MKTIIEKIKAGDALTNAELDKALNHYETLTKMLVQHGETYRLVWKDAYMTLMTLQGFEEARRKP